MKQVAEEHRGKRRDAIHSAPPPLASSLLAASFPAFFHTARRINSVGVSSQGHSFIYTFRFSPFCRKKKTTLHLFVPPDRIQPILTPRLLPLSLAGGVLFLFFEEGGTVAALASARTAGSPPEPEHLSGNQSHAAGFISDQPVS